MDFCLSDADITIITNKFNNLSIKYSIDYDKIDLDSLQLTHSFEGDTIRINNQTKKLKKLFIEKKVPQRSREFIPILRDKNGIIAVCFIGTDCTKQGNNNNIIFRSTQNAKRY